MLGSTSSRRPVCVSARSSWLFVAAEMEPSQGSAHVSGYGCYDVRLRCGFLGYYTGSKELQRCKWLATGIVRVSICPLFVVVRLCRTAVGSFANSMHKARRPELA
jgi:hypothetical protein